MVANHWSNDGMVLIYKTGLKITICFSTLYKILLHHSLVGQIRSVTDVVEKTYKTSEGDIEIAMKAYLPKIKLSHGFDFYPNLMFIQI